MHHPRGRSGLRAPNEGIQHGSNSNRVISFSVDVFFFHWHDHSFCPIVLLFFLQQQGSRNLWLRKQVSVWCVADTASLLLEMNVRAYYS